MSERIKKSFVNTDIEPIYIGGCNATISYDGTIMATAVMEDIIVTNIETQEIVHSLEGDGELLTVLQITPDGKYLAIVSRSQQLKIFNLETSKFERSFKLSSPVYISSADPTSSLFAFGGSDGSVTVWDISGGYVTHSFKGHGTTVCSLAFHGDLNTKNWKLASGDIMGSVRIWDLVKRKCLKTLNEHSGAARGVGFNQSGEVFVSGGRDNLYILWNTESWKEIKTVSAGHQIEKAGFTTALDGSELLYTAGGDSSFKLWDIKSDAVLAQHAPPLKTNEELIITDVILTETEKAMLVLSDQTICDVSLYLDEDDSSYLPVNRIIAGNHGTIADMRFVGSEFNMLALATNSPSVRIVDLERPLEMSLHEGHTDLLNAVDASRDGKWFATASKDDTARLWRWNDDSESFECYAVMSGHAGSVTAVALPTQLNNGYPHFVLTASADLTVKSWSIPSPERKNTDGPVEIKLAKYTRKAHEKDINSITVSPANELFITASYDKTAKVWDLESGETIGILKGHKRGLWNARVSFWDKLVATASGDKTIKLWSLEDFTCKKTFEGHTNAVQRVEFIDKGRFLLSAGADGLVKIWDISSGECVNTLNNHDNRLWALCVKDDGKQIISADADGAITIWDDNTEEALAEQEEKDKVKVEQEQSLRNYISDEDWSNAFLLALTLDHPMRLYNVVKASINAGADKDSSLGSFKLEKCIASLESTQLLQLFKRIRDWNTNAKFFEIAQKLINTVFRIFDIEKLSQIQGMMSLIDAITPYSERHFARLDDLIEQTYILDYALKEMDKLTAA
ncbi:unnamed protein product [Kuraishia capsulata CBS 1993]|uniref:U3 small nucleolar RNA-associated protein 13 C-terminal domain-containing protein n=1 Tax=Kuraishia capsulata CBS 1993 TaxID=1382522 RepID=W6MJT9_9ASCO|nr:uncharacterized protein KUCA_T00002778001 [Kuraishia capsulata CBS 1993]CDK26804.1 unnamed protein product [Kuraishia capsulata CBS 1993]